MSDEQNKSSDPRPAPAPAETPSAPERVAEMIEGSIGYSEGYRGIDVVNLAPVQNVPDPGGLPPPDSGSGDAPAAPTVSPAEAAPASSSE